MRLLAFNGCLGLTTALQLNNVSGITHLARMEGESLSRDSIVICQGQPGVKPRSHGWLNKIRYYKGKVKSKYFMIIIPVVCNRSSLFIISVFTSI